MGKIFISYFIGELWYEHPTVTGADPAFLNT